MKTSRSLPPSAIAATVLVDHLLKQEHGCVEKATPSAQFVRTINLSSEDCRQIDLLNAGTNLTRAEIIRRLREILYNKNRSLAEVIGRLA